MSAFINKYVHTGRLVPKVKATWRHHLGFFSRKEVISFVNALPRERAKLVNSAEAGEIIGCSRSTLGRLISSGQLTPTSGRRVDNTHHYYFPKRQIENFGKTRNRRISV
ncbi:MAG: hypothetical protein QOE96_2847 [Blastocatellia bacterium]|jgi:hypothetical protein|nr:hypothetical protein [Blastocatellia bacterium]